MRTATICFFVYFSFFYQHLFAQEFEVNVTELNNSQGLSGLAVLNLFVDAENKIWIETEHGLDYWDGRAFRKTPLPAFPIGGRPKSGKNISTIGEDNESIYFIYDTQADYFYQYNKNYHSFSKKNYFSSSVIKPEYMISAKDKSNVAWVLYKSENEIIISTVIKTKRLSINSEQLSSNFIEEFYVGAKGFWLRDTLMNISHISFEGNITQYQQPTSKIKLNIDQVSNAFYESETEDLYYSLPGFAGLYRQSRNQSSPDVIPNIPSDQLVVKLWTDNHERKLIGLSSQRQVIKNYMITALHDEFVSWNLLADLSVIPTDIVSPDFYQLIYYGTHQGLKVIQFHVPYIQKEFIEPNVNVNQYGNVFTTILGMGDNRTIAATEDEQGYLFTSIFEQVNALSPKSVGQYGVSHNETSSAISLMRNPDSTGDLQLTYNLLTGKKSSFDLPLHMFGATQVSDSLILYCGNQKDRMRLVIFNVYNQAVEILPATEYPLITKSNINHIHFDKDNYKIYFGTFDNGLLKSQWQNNTLYPATSVAKEDLPKKNIISINQNHIGDLLIGSYNGLYIIDSKTEKIKKHLSTADGLSNNVVAAVLQDETHRYWVSTFSGLNVIDLEDYRIGKFFIRDGISHDEFNRNAAHRNEQGQLFFGSANGITSVNPKIYDHYNSPFQIQFSRAKLGTNELEMQFDTIPTSPVEVSINHLTHLDISLGNSSWGSTDKVEYFYQIIGLESTWNKSSSGNIRIDRLPTGTFTVLMKGLSGHGQWSNNTLDFPIRVFTPFFYKTWVRILLLALILALLASSFLWRKQRQLKQRLEFQQRVSNLELSLLQSQMNPHFIFNALGSIQYYIFNNQKDIAEEYLSKFANLMRMFLESSRNKFLSLKDELKLLHGYIELEHMRFPDKFESESIIDLEDSPDNYQLPSMLLQPFVENSISHGLFHLQTKGRLLLKIYDDHDFLYCIIEDNGIGRELAKELRTKSLRKHKSRATQITEERIEILKEVENMHLEIKYDDLTVAKDGHTGTRVTIKIPINLN